MIFEAARAHVPMRFLIIHGLNHMKLPISECFLAAQVALMVKNPPVNAGDAKDKGFDPWVGKIPWRRARQPTSVSLPGESHGQKNLAGYSL